MSSSALLPAISLNTTSDIRSQRLLELAKGKGKNKLPDMTSFERLSDLLDGFSAWELEPETSDPQFSERSLDWENSGSWHSMLSMINELTRTLDRPFVVFLGSGEAEASEISITYGQHLKQTDFCCTPSVSVVAFCTICGPCF